MWWWTETGIWPKSFPVPNGVSRNRSPWPSTYLPYGAIKFPGSQDSQYKSTWKKFWRPPWSVGNWLKKRDQPGVWREGICTPIAFYPWRRGRIFLWNIWEWWYLRAPRLPRPSPLLAKNAKASILEEEKDRTSAKEHKQFSDLLRAITGEHNRSSTSVFSRVMTGGFWKNSTFCTSLPAESPRGLEAIQTLLTAIVYQRERVMEL